MPVKFRFVTQFIRRLHGGSQPVLVMASDGLPYVVKFFNNPQGANLLFNEAMGSELYQTAKLPIPGWKPLFISDSFIDANSGCWLQNETGTIRPTSCLCFASSYLGYRNRRLYQVLPSTYYSRLKRRSEFWLAWCLDVCERHADVRQALFVEEDDRSILA